MRRARGSAAPERETPSMPWPGRPRSWTVVNMPGLSITIFMRG